MAFPSGKEQPISHEIPPPKCKAPQEQQKVERSRNAAPSKQRSGYNCEFVQKPQELQNDCPICLFVLREPFQVTCCGYSFCHACIEHTLSNRKTCPTCNEATFSAFPNKGLQRSLYSFRVRCTHQKSGCEWTGELRELDGHLNLNQELNKRLIGCEFAAIACTHCYEYFQRRCVYAHESESCPQRPFSCEYCKDYCSVYKDVVNSHWQVCKSYPVPCPNQCGVSSERQKVEAHVNSMCPLAVVNCDFNYAGCEVKIVRKDMPTHLAEGLASHIKLLTNQAQLLIKSKNGHENLHQHLSLLALHNLQLTQLTLQLKKSLEESQDKIQELEKRMQAQATINANLQKCCEASEHKTEALTLKVAEEMAELRGKQEHSLVESHHKAEELEREKHANKCEIDVLKIQRDKERASLAALQWLPAKFVMTNFKEMKARNEQWHSPPFYTQGYKLCLRVDANGYKSEYISVFAFLMRGEFDDRLKWPFQGHVTVAMLNQLEDNNHTSHTMRFTEAKSNSVIGRVTNGDIASSGWGCQNFIAHTDLNFKPAKKCQYLKDDCLHFQIVKVELR